jgi:hypothetical protein
MKLTAHFVFNRGSFVAVKDSFFSEFHCISGTGQCTDAKPVGDGTNNHVGDTDKAHAIVNNFLTCGAQCLLSGGAAAVITPTSIEWRNNYGFQAADVGSSEFLPITAALPGIRSLSKTHGN